MVDAAEELRAGNGAPIRPPSIRTVIEDPERVEKPISSFWRLLLICAALLSAGGAGASVYYSLAKKSQLSDLATQGDVDAKVRAAIAAHAAEPGHALELRQQDDDRARLRRVEEAVNTTNGKVDNLNGKVDALLRVLTHRQ